MFDFIYSFNYIKEIFNIYSFLCERGLDSTKLNKSNLTILEVFKSLPQYTKEEKEKFEKLYYEQIEKLDLTTSDNLAIFEKEIEKYGKILTNKTYLTNPTIGREEELENLIITLAQEKKSPIIVGASGVGKTSLVEQLAYQIKEDNVPTFLKNKIILEISPSNLVAGCKYVGEFEETMKRLMDVCIRYQPILFIDEIHTIYGTGSSENNKNDMSVMLRYYIDRLNLKVIGTTTEEEYETFFASDSLKRRFEKIIVKEPTEGYLYIIIDKVIDDYLTKNNLSLEKERKEKIIDVLMFLTDKKYRVYNDVVNNPDLVISIIDKAFAYVKAYDEEFISEEHFAKAISLCTRIYPTICDEAINKLKVNSSMSSKKLVRINFNAKKRY